ncbi:hypothetical protein ABPG74_003703 [Tetrahymena malaccensis]
MDIQTGNTNFQANINSSNQTHFSLVLQKDGDEFVKDLKFQYLAINIKDSFVLTGFMNFQEKIYNCDPNFMCAKLTFMYQKTDFDRQKWNVTVGFYFIGIEKVQLSNAGYSLSILNEIFYSSKSFDIIIKTRDQNIYNKINKIYYNYIEIYQQIDNSYYHFSNIRDDSINPISSSNPLTFSSTEVREFQLPTYKFNIDVTSGIFLGVTGFECIDNFRFEIPQVFTGEIDFPRIPELMNAGKGQATSHISHTVQFTSTPQILLAINNMDISTDNTNFQATISSSDSNQFSLVLQKDCDAIIYALNIQYLAINIKDSFVLTGHFNFQENIYTCDPNWMCAKQTFMYQKSNFDSQKWKVTIGFYFIGLEKVQLQNSGYGLSFLNDIAYHSNSFDIIIKTRDRNVYSKINKIYYNYIEIYQQINNSYYYISNIRDDSINPINTGNPMTLPGSSGSPPRYSYIPTDKFNIDVTSGFSILLIIFIVRCTRSFNFIKIPQVITGEIDFMQIPELQKAGTGQATSHIYHTNQFTSTPQILLALSYIDFVMGDTIFQATINSSNSTHFSLLLQKYGKTNLYRLKFQYLAINIKDCFVITGNFNFQENIYTCDPNWICAKQTFMYQKSNYDSQKQNVTVGFYFIGLDKVQLQNKGYSLSFLNEIVYNSNSFDIIIKTSDQNIKSQIKKIYYNYIEIYQQINSSYYYISNVRDNSINPIGSSNPLTSSSFGPRYSQFPTYKFNIDVTSGIFLGITGEPQIQYILQILLANGSIIQKASCRMYMIVFQVFENILFPLVVVSFKSSYVGQMSSLIAIQTMELIITCYIRPFQNKLVNIQFIFEQGTWIIPQVITGEIDFMQIPELQQAGSGQASSHIKHTIQFTSTPQILLAINTLDIIQGDINFQATISSSNSTHFSLLLQKYGNTNLYHLKFQYLAINLKDCFVTTGYINFQENIYNCDSIWMCKKQTFMYQKSNFDSQKWNVTVGFYFIGLDKIQLQNAMYSLSLINEIVYSSNRFDIIIKTRDQNIYNKINKIYFNYIEIYQQIDNSYYHISNIRDDSINPISSSNPLISSQNAPRQYQFPPNKLNIDVDSGIFLGITGSENEGITNKFQVLNFFKYQMDFESQDNNSTLDYQFKYNNISSSLLKNSGGGFFTLIIPQVITGEIDFMQIPELQQAGSGQATSHIKHTIQFTSTPQILLAMNMFDVVKGDINFQATISSSNSTHFSLLLQKYGNTNLYHLKFQYLAINLKDCFVTTGYINFQENIYNCDSIWMCKKQTFMYQKTNFDSQKWNVTVGFYFIGLDKIQLQNAMYSLSLINEIVYSSNRFDIIIKTRDQNIYNKINKIYFNYIEIYQQIDNSYYHISNIRDDSINPISSSNPLISSQNAPRQYQFPPNKLNIDVDSGIFLGITGLESIFEIPQVFTGEVKFITIPQLQNAGTGQATSHIYHNIQFTSTPLILLVINQLDIIPGDINFQATISSSNSTHFSLVVQKYGNTNLYYLKFQYLAVNLKDSFVITGNLNFQENKISCDPNWMCAKQTLMYQKSNFDSQKWKVTVGFYFIGIDKVQLQNAGYSLSFLNEIVYNSNSFDIIIKTRDQNIYNKINKIYYNYIEIYQQIDNSYYIISNIRDDSINPISSSNPLTLTSSSTAIRYSQFPYKFNIDVTQGIILGITGVEQFNIMIFRKLNSVLNGQEVFNGSYSSSLLGIVQSVGGRIGFIICIGALRIEFISSIMRGQSGAFTQQILFKQKEILVLGQNQVEYSLFQVCAVGSSKMALQERGVLQNITSQQSGFLSPSFNDLTASLPIFLQERKIPQVFIGDVTYFVNIGELQLPGQRQATHSINHSVQFTSTPQILLAIQEFDLVKGDYNFQATVSSSSSTQFSLTLQKDGASGLANIKFQYLAINLKDSFVKTGHLNFQENIVSCVPNWMCSKQTFNYQKSNYNSQKQNVTVGFYFVGIEKVQLQNTVQTISFINEIVYSSSSFDIIIKTRDFNIYNKINKIYYNYIEIYQQIDKNYYHFFNKRDDSINPIPPNNPLTQPSTQPRYSQFPTYNINIDVISDEGITKKFQALNAFKYYMDFESQDHNSTLDYQFKYNNISSSLAKNSGGGFFTLIIIIIFQFLSQILTSSQCQSDFFKIYDQFISSLFIQLLQSLILLFFYSSLLYMLDDKQVKGVPGYVFLIIYFVYIILALIIQSIALFKLKINEKRFNQYEPQIQDILQIQLANGSILQKAQSRMYMIIFQIFENILFPLVVVSFKSSYIGQMSSLITIQTLEFIITLYIRPFQNKLVNISFIFEQGTWIVIYVLFCVQSCLIDQLDPTIQVYPQNITILLIVILFLICFAVLINPIFQLIQIFILLKQCYQQKKTRNKNSTQKDLNDTKQINKKMLMDINFQELTDYQYKR